MFRKLFLLISLMPALLLRAQEDVQFSHLTMKDGLSMNPVMAMAQDPSGFMWFGTQDGLNRYDGYSFRVYKSDDSDSSSISDNFITALDATYSTHLWVGTFGGGLNKLDFNTGKFTRYQAGASSRGGLRSNRIWCMTRINMQLWIGTDSGVSVWDDYTRNFENPVADYPFLGKLQHQTVLTIFRDLTGVFWIGTTNGLYQCSGNNCELLQHNDQQPGSLSNDIVLSIYQDKHGGIWAGTVDGLNQFDAGTKKFNVYTFEASATGGDAGTVRRSAIQNIYSIINNYGGNTVRTILEDGSGKLWIGTDHELVVFNPVDGKFFSYRHDISNPFSISGQFIRSMMLDRSGNLWIGTLGTGLNKTNMNQKKFRTYQRRNDLPSSVSENYIRAFAEDSTGAVWVGTLVGGLNKLDPKTGNFSAINKSNSGISDDNTWSLKYDDKKHRLWIGTNNGLNCMDISTGKFTIYQYDKTDSASISENTIRCIHIDTKGRLWCGTEGGLNMLDETEKKFTRYTSSNSSLSNNTVWKIAEDKSGILWLATNDGFNRFDPSTGKITVYRKQNGNVKSISSNACRTVFIDSKNRYWVGTQSGFNRFDPSGGNFTRYDERSGLPNNFIYTVEEDDKGNLWLSTNKGLCKMNPETGRCTNYDVFDGLQDYEFNTNASFRTRNGEMYFGGPSGFNRFSPSSMPSNLFMPPVIITEINVLNEPYAGDTSASRLKQLELRYDQNILSFSFSALDYTNSSRNQYSYKLEGFDREWIYPGTQHIASYTNLDPGEYLLKVRGTNSDGIWSVNVAELSIIIHPPFWRTAWFYTFCALCIILLIYLVYRWRVRSLQREKTVLEEKVALRTNDLQKANAELEQLSLVASKSDNAVVITDQDGVIIWVNDSVKQKNKLAANDGLIGISLFETSTNKKIRDLAEEAVREEKSVVYESFILSSDGTRYWVASTLTPIFDEQKKLRKIIIVDSDITGRKNAEEIIRQKNKDITDSITYAKRIQQAILPDIRKVKQYLPESFVCYMPRDIVSGDFYFFTSAGEYSVWAVVDCTGHGVPGAFMSVIGNNLLKQIVSESQVSGPGIILEELDLRLALALNQSNNNDDDSIRDGMDIALCAYNHRTKELLFSGAHRSLVMIRDGVLQESHSSKQAIGGFRTSEKMFTDVKLDLKPGDMIYLFTDGYADQFGGERGKKFKHKTLLQLLLDIHRLSPEEQEQRLRETHVGWRGNLEQVDDILVFGVRIN